MANYEAKRGDAVSEQASLDMKELFNQMKQHFECFMIVGFNKSNPNDRAFGIWGDNGADYMLSMMNAAILMSNVFEDATPEDIVDGVKEMLAIGKLEPGCEEMKKRSEALMRKFGKIKIPKDAKEFKDGSRK